MLSPSPDLFRTAYNQITSAERSYVDRLVAQMVEEAQARGRPLTDLVDAPIPPALTKQDSRGWLQRPLVIAAITERVRDVQHYKDISIDTLIRQLFAIATFSLEEITRFDDMGDPYFDLENASADQWAALESIDVEKSDGLSRTTKTKIKIKRESKTAAIKQLTELLGGPEAVNSYLKQQRASHTPQLTDSSTVSDAADEYQKMIGDDRD